MFAAKIDSRLKDILENVQRQSFLSPSHFFGVKEPNSRNGVQVQAVFYGNKTKLATQQTYLEDEIQYMPNSIQLPVLERASEVVHLQKNQEKLHCAVPPPISPKIPGYQKDDSCMEFVPDSPDLESGFVNTKVEFVSDSIDRNSKQNIEILTPNSQSCPIVSANSDSHFVKGGKLSGSIGSRDENSKEKLSTYRKETKALQFRTLADMDDHEEKEFQQKVSNKASKSLKQHKPAIVQERCLQTQVDNSIAEDSDSFSDSELDETNELDVNVIQLFFQYARDNPGSFTIFGFRINYTFLARFIQIMIYSVGGIALRAITTSAF